MRPWLLATVLTSVAVLAACSDASTTAEIVQQSSSTVGRPAVETSLATSTTMPEQSSVATTTPNETTETSSTSVSQAATTLASPTTLVSSTTTVSNSGSTSLVPTTTVRAVSGPPRLVLSQSTGLASSGTRITVRGSGFDVTKGVYVIVCNQAAWTDSRRCVGGVNIDGSSPVSEWVSSNPPAYAKGLTIPFAADGSFTITLLARAKGDEIDCTKEQCGVVSFADHTRRDDRSQDVFVPVSFVGGT
ncbi:MAG: hypothetical protein ACKOXX_07370 [Actinomycetota bacterium]